MQRDYAKGDAGIKYPQSIRYNPEAQVFYGTTLNLIQESNEDYEATESTAELAIEIKKIIEKHVQVDWHNNTDIHNKMKQELDDLIYDFKENKGISLSLEQLDKMIEEIIKISLNRY